MQDQVAPVRAAIDVGSNTIHIVVASCLPDALTILVDEEEMVRIGASVDATGAISPQKSAEAIAVLRAYKALAEQHQSEVILTIATEAIRKASNSAEFIADVQRQTGLDVQIIEGTVEAVLTFFGATYELQKETHDAGSLGVMDLGGGSMELVAARARQISWHLSLPIGSGWLQRRYLPADPPTVDDLDVASTFLHTYLRGIRIKPVPPILVATGGSANSLLRLVRHTFGPQHPAILTREDLAHCEGLLGTLTAQEISERYEQQLARVRVLPAGALIIRSVMERLGLKEIHVSSHGIREGALLAHTRYGDRWLEQVQRISDASRNPKGVAEVTEDRLLMGTQDEGFVRYGRYLLAERARKVVEWREAVLRHEDIEDVHKMRVASRRLRAVLDAYESACEQRAFKRAYRKVKKLADVLGQARDTDVMIENLQQMEQAPEAERFGLLWLIARLREYRRQHQKALEAYLGKFDDELFVSQVTACLPKGGPD
ncbi:CHAD domain-containing protein [Ktedonosporobacter rubrisoli]|uniref:CHAD domain-containing protein n=1 Tax=Ktedonosporobacter rubrisoli TaxID=2509675 RepID=A0A4P6JUA7_KTERU|nr:CHAD domain-containing protein [Ktedonosporobacter rubrisoli]QBD78913.1 CHAD domain-containing protein [Ktedonosporobacter rubrisoli]